VASVTLFATIEEVFGLEIDIQDMKHLLSFQSLLQYLERHAGQHGG
jgi:acyl carrier protein